VLCQRKLVDEAIRLCRHAGTIPYITSPVNKFHPAIVETS
jgi:hypothetical protein